MTRATLPPQIVETRLVVVARRLDDEIYEALEELADAGERLVFEVTLDDPRAVQRIRTLAARGRTVGAGTVLTRDAAQGALDAGAQFLVSPFLDEELVAEFTAQGVPFIPGAMTPSEIVRAWDAGAPLVKIFPASVTGPALLRELRGPLGHVPLMPTGGISAANAAAFLSAGAAAVGVGGSLTGGRAGEIATRWAELRGVVESTRVG